MSSSTIPEAVVAPRIEQHQLANGLNILLQPDHCAPVVSIQFWVETGSIHETPWLGAGLSHLLEHLMFKGTPTRGNSQMAQDIHRLGGHLNAYTSFDRTVYYVDLPAENAVEAMDILGDAVFSSTLPEDEYDKEMEVIRREFAMGKDNPDSEMGKLLFQTAYLKHPYRYPVIGHLDLFNQLTRADVLAYYRSRYTPQNVSLIVCGAISAETLFTAATERLGKYPRRPLVEITNAFEAVPSCTRTSRVGFETELTRLALCWHIPGIHHADVPALDLLATLLGGGRSSRLNLICVEKLGLAEQIDAFAYTPSGQGLLGVDGRCKPENEVALLAEIRKQLKLISEVAPEPEEVARAVRLNTLYYANYQKTMSGKASLLGRSWLYLRDPQFTYRYYARVQKVTPAEILAVAQRYILPEGEVSISLVPPNFLYKKGAAEEEHVIAPITEKISLARNDFKTLFVKQTRVPLFSVRAALAGGLMEETESKQGIGRLAAHLLTKGTRHHSAEELARKIEQLGGSIAADMGTNSAYLNLELLSSEWQPGLDLFCEMLVESAPTEAELETERRKQLSSIQAEKDYPMAIARDLIRQMLYPGHPYQYKSLGTPESVEAITLKDILGYLHSTLLTQDAVLAVSGPILPDMWSGRIERVFGELAPARHPQLPVLKAITAPARREERVAKQQAVLQIAFPTVPFAHDDHIALGILDEALSDLGSRLFIRIREQLGLAYFVGTTQFFGRAGSHFVFYVGTDPKKRVEIEAALLEEIAGVANHGITEAEVVRARAKLLSNEKLEQQNASHLASTAALDELVGLGYDYQNIRRKRMAEIDIDGINEVAKRYFSTPNFVTAIVSPE